VVTVEVATCSLDAWQLAEVSVFPLQQADSACSSHFATAEPLQQQHQSPARCTSQHPHPTQQVTVRDFEQHHAQSTLAAHTATG
jgi:hypothetical protein